MRQALDPMFSNLMNSMMPIVLIAILLGLAVAGVMAAFGGPKAFLMWLIEMDALKAMAANEARKAASKDARPTN